MVFPVHIVTINLSQDKRLKKQDQVKDVFQNKVCQKAPRTDKQLGGPAKARADPQSLEELSAHIVRDCVVVRSFCF